MKTPPEFAEFMQVFPETRTLFTKHEMAKAWDVALCFAARRLAERFDDGAGLLAAVEIIETLRGKE